MQRAILGAIATMGLCRIGAAQTTAIKLPEGEGNQVTERVCSACHGIETVVSEQHPKAEWQKIVDDMAARGADASDAELKTIVEYLSKYFGPKNSNPK